MRIADLNADERNSLLTVRTEDGDVFEIVCRQGQFIITKDGTRVDSGE